MVQGMAYRAWKEIIMSDKCECRLCKLSAELTEALHSDDIDFVKDALRKFSDLWLCADFDNNYYQAILDGSWPSAEEILTRSLEKAKTHKEKQNGNE